MANVYLKRLERSPNKMKFASLKKHMDEQEFEAALSEVDRLLAKESGNAYLWNLRGDLVQLLDTKDGPPLAQAAESYRKALEINPNDLEAIEGLAHFYDVIERRPSEAKKYAKQYLDKTKKSLLEMNRILEGDRTT